MLHTGQLTGRLEVANFLSGVITSKESTKVYATYGKCSEKSEMLKRHNKEGFKGTKAIWFLHLSKKAK
uniref:Uncharacterized protein n=1 Tax=Helianthus annuus TaxID=4232 RepID=A0A251V515_HELAN